MHNKSEEITIEQELTRLRHQRVSSIFTFLSFRIFFCSGLEDIKVEKSSLHFFSPGIFGLKCYIGRNSIRLQCLTPCIQKAKHNEMSNRHKFRIADVGILFSGFPALFKYRAMSHGDRNEIESGGRANNFVSRACKCK